MSASCCLSLVDGSCSLLVSDWMFRDWSFTFTVEFGASLMVICCCTSLFLNAVMKVAVEWDSASWFAFAHFPQLAGPRVLDGDGLYDLLYYAVWLLLYTSMTKCTVYLCVILCVA